MIPFQWRKRLMDNALEKADRKLEESKLMLDSVLGHFYSKRPPSVECAWTVRDFQETWYV